VGVFCLIEVRISRVLFEWALMLPMINGCVNVRLSGTQIVNGLQAVTSHEGRGLPLEG
jgi:hypothetical protein